MNIGRFFKNLYYLTKIDLKKADKKLQDSITHDKLHDILDNYIYEVTSQYAPRISSINECINEIIEKKVSICRFGDGEINLILGRNIPFQIASKELSSRMKVIFSSKNPKILIGIPSLIYQNKNNIENHSRKFLRDFGREIDQTTREYIDINRQYYPSEFTLAYTIYVNYDHKKYFQTISNIWRNRDVTIICGKSVFDKIEHNIFDCAKSVEYLYAPATNAYNTYNELLHQSKKIAKNRLVIILLGPTATVLAYDLALENYQALDMGHIAKAYDWYIKNNNVKDQKSAYNFYNPD